MDEEAQTKREKFRHQIRKKYLNEKFNKIRNHQKSHKFNQFSQAENQSVNKAASIVKEAIIKLIGFYERRDYSGTMDLIQNMQALCEQNIQIFSMCLNNQINQKIVGLIDMKKKDFNSKRIQNLLDYGNNNKIEEADFTKNNEVMVQQLMKISQNIQYSKFSLESTIVMIKVLWNVVSEKYYLKKGQHALDLSVNQKILTALCYSFSELLSGPHHCLAKEHLVSLGLSEHLSYIVKISSKISIQTQIPLLNLLNIFFDTSIESRIEPGINGITIISTNDCEKSIFALFCIANLKKKDPRLYQLSASVLNCLFEELPYFIDSITKDYYKEILLLTKHLDRNINFSALTLLSTIVFFSLSASDDLIQNFHLLDYLYDRLCSQKNNPRDQNTVKSIEKCTNIFCDLIQTNNVRPKKIIINHHIWQIFQQGIDERSIFFPTIVVYKFFFRYFKRSDRKKFLSGYLDLVKNLPMQNNLLQQIKQVKQTLTNMYYLSEQHANDIEHEFLVRQLEQNNLLRYIQNFDLEPVESTQ